MKFEPKEIARQLREEYQDETDTEADALMLDAATCIEELSSALSETVKWVPVSERLPDEWVRVIVRDEDGYIKCACKAGGWAGRFTTALTPDASGHAVFRITHWMPIPEAPK